MEQKTRKIMVVDDMLDDLQYFEQEFQHLKRTDFSEIFESRSYSEDAQRTIRDVLHSCTFEYVVNDILN